MTQTFDGLRPVALKGSLLALMSRFSAQMQAQGYAPTSLKISVRLVQGFATWIDQCGIDGRSVEYRHVDAYLDERWLQRRRRRGDAFTLRAFVQFV